MIFIFIYILLGVFALYIISGLIINIITFKKSYGAHQIEEITSLAHWDFYEKDYNRRKVTFPSEGNMLAGYIYSNKDKSARNNKLLVFSHGIWSGPEEYMMLIMWFVDRGYDVFTYSYTAYNDSQGKWAKGLPQSHLDLDAALTFIENDSELNVMPKALIGHSWGAYASTAALRFPHDVKASVALSGFSAPLEISVAVGKQMLGKIGGIWWWMIDLFNAVLFGRNYRNTAIEGINKSGIPVLLVHGANDEFIDINTTSIVCHKSEIRNGFVEYITLTDPVQSGHNNYFCSKESTEYFNELMKDYNKLKDSFGKKKLPREAKKKFFDEIDKKLANEPNAVLYEQIESFLIKTM